MMVHMIRWKEDGRECEFRCLRYLARFSGGGGGIIVVRWWCLACFASEISTLLILYGLTVLQYIP